MFLFSSYFPVFLCYVRVLAAGFVVEEVGVLVGVVPLRSKSALMTPRVTCH
eukprot:m.16459 g.16459  ORF g.16459 m.16459 type:complete len:51 (+) comp26950_c0_seq1:313-465(+)